MGLSGIGARRMPSRVVAVAVARHGLVEAATSDCSSGSITLPRGIIKPPDGEGGSPPGPARVAPGGQEDGSRKPSWNASARSEVRLSTASPRKDSPVIGTTAIVRSGLAALLCAVLAPAAAQESGELDALRRHALDLVNAARSEAGLSELRFGSALNEAAQGHATDMAREDYYAHVAPDGETPFARFRAAGGSRWAISGENIARCTGCTPPPDTARVDAFQEGWMQSPEHRENILSDGFDRFGFGITSDENRIYAVQTFAGPGSDGGGRALDAGAARAVALEELNVRREEDGLEPLEASEALDQVAEGVLEARRAGEDPPEDIFELLPDGAEGWTSIAVRSASRGGSGTALSHEDIIAFVSGWAGAEIEDPLGGPRAGSFGFAAAVSDDGRATAVAVFGGRG